MNRADVVCTLWPVRRDDFIDVSEYRHHGLEARATKFGRPAMVPDGQDDEREERLMTNFGKQWVRATFTLLMAVAVCMVARSPVRAAEPASTPAAGKTVRVFCLGNSFSGNATRYLKDLAAAGGQTLVLKQVTPGGYSLAQYTKVIETIEAADEKAALTAPADGVRQFLGEGPWDVVTIQQYSFISHDVSTYRPYAKKVYDYVKKRAPGARVVMHETWAYRVDDPRFADGKFSQKLMYEQLSAAYRTIAGELGVEVIPVGDAFYKVDTDPQWGYRPEAGFDKKAAVYPKLPEQGHSLHVGWKWGPDKAGNRALGMDGHHASDNGCYLAGCVWFEYLFGQSVVGNTCIPKAVGAEKAAYLQRIAHEVMEANRTQKAAAVPK